MAPISTQVFAVKSNEQLSTGGQCKRIMSTSIILSIYLHSIIYQNFNVDIMVFELFLTPLGDKTNAWGIRQMFRIERFTIALE